VSARKPKKILCVDWDPRTLRVVHASVTKRGAKIDRLLSVAIPTDVDSSDAAQMGAHLRRVLNQEDIGTRHVIVDVPRDQVILNTLNLPVNVPDALPNIVGIQVAKQLPYALADAVVDFVVVPHDGKAATGEVLVAAVRKEVLSKYEAVFRAAGVKLDRVGLRPSANRVAAARFLRHASFDRVLMIDVRPHLTEINLIRNSFLTFSRAASVHIPDRLDEPAATPVSVSEPALRLITPDEPVPESAVDSGGRPSDLVIASLVVEVTRSIEAYRATDPGAKMDHVVIGGDLGIEERLAEALQLKLGVTAEIYNPAATFGWEPDEGASASAFSASLGGVIGYAEEDALQFNFLRPKRTESVAGRRLKKAPLVAAVAVLFIAAAGVAFASYTRPKRDKLATIEAEIKKLETAAKSEEHEKFLALAQSIKSFDKDQFIWVDVLLDIVGRLPPQEQMVIDQIDANQQKDGQVKLKAKWKQSQAIYDTIQAINEARGEYERSPRYEAKQAGQQSVHEDKDYPVVQDLIISLVRETANKSPKDGPHEKQGT